MKHEHALTFIIIVLLHFYCYGEEDIDEIEPDEYAYYLDDVLTNDRTNLNREKRSLRLRSYRYSPSRNRGRKEERFRIRARYRPNFRRPPSSAPSVRKPGVKPSSVKPSYNSPKVSNPDVNKPGVAPAFNGGNGMVQNQNSLQGSSNPGVPYGGPPHNPNIYHPPPPVYQPPPGGGPVVVQQPNQYRPPQPNQGGSSNRPLPIPIPIPIPLGNPFGGRHGAPHNNEHNENAVNRSNQSAMRRDVKGGSGNNRYKCNESTKRLLFIVINLYIFILYCLL